jgi:hypothetical protein
MSSGPGKLVVPMFVLGLLSGAALGSWGQRAFQRRHGRPDMPDAQRALEHMDRELHFDDRQKDVMKKILLAKQAESAAQEKEHREKAETLRQAVRKEISAVLNPDQQTKFQAMCDRADERFKERWPENK